MWKELGEKSTWTWCEDEASGRANVHIAEDQADPIISIMLLASLSASLVATSTPLIPRSDSQGHQTSAEEYRIRRLRLDTWQDSVCWNSVPTFLKWNFQDLQPFHLSHCFLLGVIGLFFRLILSVSEHRFASVEAEQPGLPQRVAMQLQRSSVFWLIATSTTSTKDGRNDTWPFCWWPVWDG